MATASVTYTTAAGYTGTGTLTYSVSSTNTATTFSATKFIVTSDYKTNYICRAVMDGDVFVNILHDGGGAISYTKSWNKSTSAQTKNLDLQWYETVNGQTRILKTTTVQISIPALASYSVTYNANGGTGTTASQTKYYGQNLTLRANGFTKTGYSFKCWNTSTSDPAASRYAAGATYTGNAALALYAIWNPIISFNANGGSGAPSNQTKTFNTALTLTTAKPTRTGYTFGTWNTAANGSGTSYASGGTVAASMNTAMTLYAQWTANTYTISFNANGGVGAPSSISKTYGQSVTLPTDKPTRIGHTFLGWALSSSAETAQWLAGSNFSEAITANTTLYAVWRDDYESPSITTLRAYRCGFELTTDTAIDPDKTYYERSGSGTSEDPYIYTEVEEPDVSDLPTYYELIDDDEAGYARIEATWSIDTSVDEGVVNSATMTGTITPEGQPAQAITFQSGYQGTSGNAVALIDGLDVDTQYTVTVTVTDIKGASMATSRTVLLLRAFYIFDFGSQGNAVGIGRAAPQSGMEVGYPATFDDTVNLYDELQFNGEQAYPTFSRSSWSTSSDQTTLPVTPCFVHDTTSGVTYWCDGTTIASLGYLPISGGTMTGDITIANTNPHLYIKDTDAESNVTTSGEFDFIYFQDKNGTTIGRVNPWIDSGVQYMRYITQRRISGTTKYNILNLGLDASGNAVVSIGGDNAAAAWRGAIGALSTGGGIMTGSIYMRNTEIDRDAANPSSKQYGQKMVLYRDTNDEIIGYIQSVRETDGRIGLQITPVNEKSDGTSAYGAFTILVDKSGNTSYMVNGSENFRAAISSPGCVSANGYYGLTLPNGSTTDYMRAPQDGFIPYASGGSGYLGTSGWPWNYIYGKNIYQDGTKVSVEGHTHSYVPTSGGTVSADFTLKSSNGTLQVQHTGMDISLASRSSDQYAICAALRDKNSRYATYLQTVAHTDGSIETQIGTRCYNGGNINNIITARTYRNSTYSYYVTDPAKFRAAIGAAASSDRRLKSDISPLGEDAVEFVDALEPCVYTINGERQVGLIAQDVHEADPWDTGMAFETEDEIDGLNDWERMDDGSPTWKLDYIRVIPPLVAAVQAANRRIESLETEVAELRALVAELMKK